MLVSTKLDRSPVSIKLDISTDGPISPHAKRVTMPRSLGVKFTVMANPSETVVAEKAFTILQRGATSTRWRDYMDLRSLSRSRSFQAGSLRTAIEKVAKHPKVELSASLAGHDDLAQLK